MRMPRIVFAAFVALAAALLVSAGTAPALAQKAEFVQRFKDWSVYTYGSGAKRLCFAVSQPKDIEPKNVRADDIYLYVSSWPGDGVRNEFSFKAAAPLGQGSTLTAIVGPDVFELFADGDRAFVENVVQEARLINAMRRGAKLVVRGTTAEGRPTSAVFSLSGITAALNFVRQTCG